MLAARHARATPQAFAVRDRHRRLSYAELVAAADRLAAHLAGHGIRPGHRVAVWLPSRVETAIALLACSRNGYVCCPSLHRDHTVGEIVALVDRMRAAALIAQPGYGADADRHDVFAELAEPRFPALRLARRPGRRRAVRRIAGPGARNRAERGRQPGDVSALHLRHDRRAEGRDAQRQHAARHRADDGARLAAGARGALHAEPAQPQSRARCADHRAGRRRRTGRPRSAARREPARSAGGDRRRVSVRRADPCDRPARRDASPRRCGMPARCAASGSRAPRRRRRSSPS